VRTDPAANRSPRPPRRALARRSVALIVFAAVLGPLAVFATAVTHGLPDVGQIRAAADRDRVTMIYDAADRLLFPLYKEERIEIPLSRVSPDLVHAVIAVEDEHFYQHAGFDAARIAAALCFSTTARRSGESFASWHSPSA